MSETRSTPVSLIVALLLLVTMIVLGVRHDRDDKAWVAMLDKLGVDTKPAKDSKPTGAKASGKERPRGKGPSKARSSPPAEDEGEGGDDDEAPSEN